MSTTTPTKRQLKAAAHHLNPLVIIGQQGLSPQVLKQIDGRVRDHELVKIKLAIEDRAQRKRMIGAICASLSLELVQSIGKTATLYRKAGPDENEGRHSVLTLRECRRA